MVHWRLLRSVLRSVRWKLLSKLFSMPSDIAFDVSRSVILPIVNQQPVSLGPINPARADQVFDQVVSVAVPLHPCRDVFVGVASDSPVWRIERRE